MATQTTNYGFEKPAATDKLSVLVNYNGNLDLIDSTIKTVSDAATTASSTATAAQSTATAAQTAADAAQSTATAAGTAAAAAASVATAAQSTADSKAAIDDTAAAATTTYSSTKIETELATKQATITGAATTIVDSNLTTNRALISNSTGKVETSSVTSTELGYLSGVTSNIATKLSSLQSQISAINTYSTTNATLNSGNADYRVLHKIDHVVQFNFEYNGVADASSAVMTIPTGYRPIEDLNVPILSVNYAHMYALIKTNGQVFIGGVQSVGASETVHGSVTWISPSL